MMTIKEIIIQKEIMIKNKNYVFKGLMNFDSYNLHPDNKGFTITSLESHYEIDYENRCLSISGDIKGMASFNFNIGISSFLSEEDMVETIVSQCNVIVNSSSSMFSSEVPITISTTTEGRTILGETFTQTFENQPTLTTSSTYRLD